MSAPTFDELTHRLEDELRRLHYTEGSIATYRRAWKQIASFLEEEGLQGFTEEAGIRFLDTQYNFFTLEKAGALTQSLINRLRIVRMLGDFQQLCVGIGVRELVRKCDDGCFC